eukprot:gnl/Spiro4/23971_TR11871_c0_g1_i1.p1 gnl/Spiro4/23971_TR11871_c0_g1~~gnl/Spiro4/23971_TR11871_c0_g1_i1.p1  ORF type:complete len:156 (+),score=17.99 gnl/Spiro4/23971_TR11871_c0_g1_i1:71-538(+)
MQQLFSVCRTRFQIKCFFISIFCIVLQKGVVPQMTRQGPHMVLSFSILGALCRATRTHILRPRELYSVFRSFDRSGRGSVSAADLAAVLRSSRGIIASADAEDVASRLIAVADSRNSGSVSFEDFCVLARPLHVVTRDNVLELWLVAEKSRASCG